MDSEKFSKDTLLGKSETVNKADCKRSSLETDHSPTGCDTTLIDLINDKDTEGCDTVYLLRNLMIASRDIVRKKRSFN